MSTNYSPAVVRPGLVLFLDAGNVKSYPGSGSTVSNLIPGASYPSVSLFGDTVNYGSIANGVVTLGGAKNNSSSGTILRGAGNLGTTVNSDFSSMGWLYRTSAYSGEILSYVESSFRVSFDIDSAAMTFYQRMQNSPYTVNTTGVVVTNALNIWIHFALTKTGNSWAFYKNGALLATNTFTMNEVIPAGTAFHIGGAWSDDDYLSNCMDGKVGPIMHYTRALSTAEVQQNFNAHKGRFGL
jgi:hypothetical protein